MGRRVWESRFARAGSVCLLSLVLFSPGAASKPRRDQAPPLRITFAAVPWLTPSDSVLVLLAARGYQEVEGAGGRDLLVCQGPLFDHMAIVHGSLDEGSRLVRWKVTIVAEGSRDGYTSMRKVYDDIVAEGEAKYGLRDGWADRFRFPYEKDDGRGARALRQGHATIYSEWAVRDGDRLRVEMNEELSVVLSYECPEWEALQARLRAKEARDL
jgi:hypothetical protein